MLSGVMMVNLILTALKGKILYHQIQYMYASLDNDQMVMDFMFLIYKVMRRQVSEYGTHYTNTLYPGSQNYCLDSIFLGFDFNIFYFIYKEYKGIRNKF